MRWILCALLLAAVGCHKPVPGPQGPQGERGESGKDYSEERIDQLERAFVNTLSIAHANVIRLNDMASKEAALEKNLDHHIRIREEDMKKVRKLAEAVEFLGEPKCGTCAAKPKPSKRPPCPCAGKGKCPCSPYCTCKHCRAKKTCLHCACPCANGEKCNCGPECWCPKCPGRKAKK